MFILCLTADAANLGSWFIMFKVLTLIVTMLTMFLHLSKLNLSSVADFSKTEARTSISAECPLVYPH